MVINISVQYNGGLLPDMIPLTQGYYHRGTPLTTIYRGFVCTAYETVYSYYPMFDDVLLHCFCFVFVFCLVSLHGD